LSVTRKRKMWFNQCFALFWIEDQRPLSFPWPFVILL